MNAKVETVAEPIEGKIVMGGLTLPTNESKLLAELKKSGTRITEIEKDWAELPDLNTKEGMALAKSRRRELVSMRTDGNENKKLITKPLRDLTTSINNLFNSYLPRLAPIEELYDDAIKAFEEAKATAKREKAEAEKRRTDAIQSRIDVIKAAPLRAATIDEIDAELVVLAEIGEDVFATFDEFSDAAQIHVEAAMAALNTRRAQLVEQAEAQAKLDKQREEQEAAQKRIDDANAEIEATRKRQADESAEIERKQKEQEQRDEDARLEAEAKEEARKQGHLDNIAALSSVADNCQTVAHCNDELVRLSALTTADYQEFYAAARAAITDADKAVRDKLDSLVKQAEDKRKADEAAEVERAAQAKKDREAKAKADKAETKRIADMKPEVERLRSFLTSVYAVDLPRAESPEAQAVVDTYLARMGEVDGMISALESR